MVQRQVNDGGNPHQRRDEMRPHAAGNDRVYITLRPIDCAGNEQVPTLGCFNVVVGGQHEPSLLRRRLRGNARQHPDQRHNKKVETHERTHRVSRQADHWCAIHPAQALRFPRLDLHRPKPHVRHPCGGGFCQCLLHHVERARRHPTRRHHQIAFPAQRIKLLAERGRIIVHHHRPHLRNPLLPQQFRQHRPVRIRDRSRAQLIHRIDRRHQLVTRGNHRDRRPIISFHRGHPSGQQGSDHPRVDHCPGVGNDVAHLTILPLVSNMCAIMVCGGYHDLIR